MPPLVWTRRTHYNRDLHPQLFPPGYPGGNHYTNYTLTAKSKDAVIATVDVEVVRAKMYPPGGGQYPIIVERPTNVRLRSIWVSKKDFYGKGHYRLDSNFVPPFEDEKAVTTYCEDEWQKWLDKAGLETAK